MQVNYANCCTGMCIFKTVGLIKVDGLDPPDDFKEYIEKEKRGEVTMEDIKEYLDRKYKNNAGR